MVCRAWGAAPVYGWVWKDVKVAICRGVSGRLRSEVCSGGGLGVSPGSSGWNIVGCGKWEKWIDCE